MRHTLGGEVLDNPAAYDVPVLRDVLTKNMDGVLPAMHDELVTSLSELIPVTDGACPSVELYVHYIALNINFYSKIGLRSQCTRRPSVLLH